MRWSRNARRLVVAVSAVVVVSPIVSACTDPSNGSDEVSAAVASIDESGLQEVVTHVADDGISDDDAQIVIAALPDHLDDLTLSAEDDGPISRPEAVRFFGALAAAGQAEQLAVVLADGITDQVIAQLEEDPDTVEDAMALRLDPITAVVAAASIGVAEGDDDMSVGGFETFVTEQAREDLAVAIAEQRGQPQPVPGEFQTSLIEELGFDPVRWVDLHSTRWSEDTSEDAPWPSLG
jgi:hypothetical protein